MTAPSSSSTPKVQIVHSLLRARDWQDRPQYGQVCDWWRKGGRGVLALVGIGGAGKTAIANRFVNALPDVTDALPGQPKDKSLPVPEGLLVFSFYDVPNPEHFFDGLYEWLVSDFGETDNRRLTDSGQRVQASATLVMEALRRLHRPMLLVLDGMEKVQDDGSRSGLFGHIEDGGLRALLSRAAAGQFFGLSVLVTTRFWLSELEYERVRGQAPLFASIPVDEISEDASIALLRDRQPRGVKGSDAELRGIARACGRHALTVDLVAGYLVHFHAGDSTIPLHLLSAEELAQIAQQERDPWKAHVAEQTARFNKVAKRYQDSLAHSDPASLSLLQRVCLFRLGVSPQMLQSIFTGKGKVEISGKALAGLSGKQLQAKLTLLVEMRLLEKSPGVKGEPELYAVHPAVRDGFLAGLDEAKARAAHDAARQGLEATLGENPGEYPSNSATLDLLEEIVYHTLRAGHVQEAWDIYWSQIGNFPNLGWRLGAYGRGERMCRAFAGSRAPAEILNALRKQERSNKPSDRSVQLSSATSYPCLILSKNELGGFVNEWALYLVGLGRLDGAVDCFQCSNDMAVKEERWGNASAATQNLAMGLLSKGLLTAGLMAVEEALKSANRANDQVGKSNSHACHAHACALRGKVRTGLEDFRAALDWQHRTDKNSDRPLYSRRGYQHTALLAALGRWEEATRLTEVNKKIVTEVWGADARDVPDCNLLLADLSRKGGSLDAAQSLWQLAHEWATARDVKELLCQSALVRARIEIDKARETRKASSRQRSRAPESAALHDPARSALDDGLWIARECGYGILHIDLLLLRAQIELYEGRADAALQDVKVALDEGIHPPTDSGSPELLAANDPECGYAWGIAEGRHLRGEALLLKAAQELGQGDYVPARLKALPANIQGLIAEAQEELNAALEWWRKLRDPEGSAKINPHGEKTQRAIDQLDAGILTNYPLKSESPKAEKTGKDSKMTTTVRDQVFISYCHLDRSWLETLQTTLKPLIRTQIIDVWADTRIKAGKKWKEEISQALARAKVAVLLVSQNFLASDFIVNEELQPILEAASAAGLTVLWIPITATLYEETALADYQAAHEPSKPLDTLTPSALNQALVDIAKKIKNAANP